CNRIHERGVTMPNVFAVVGEHRDDPGRLLLRGSDDHFYAYDEDCRLHPVELTSDWNLDEVTDLAA
ncbi:MAG: hypothetical protein M3R02_18560, partial [Chloroflexota bacterium]|nr:hypothetical protein [Chloroflexota bacterium]